MFSIVLGVLLGIGILVVLGVVDYNNKQNYQNNIDDINTQRRKISASIEKKERKTKS